MKACFWKTEKTESPIKSVKVTSISNMFQQHITQNFEYIMTYTLAAFVLACFNGIHHVAINFNGEQILRKWPAAYSLGS